VLAKNYYTHQSFCSKIFHLVDFNVKISDGVSDFGLLCVSVQKFNAMESLESDAGFLNGHAIRKERKFQKKTFFTKYKFSKRDFLNANFPNSDVLNNSPLTLLEKNATR